MIKFFRHIRKSLLMDLPAGKAGNKTSKPAFAAGRYFKYAIGEIILVVLGILIALQINNWNENRIASIDELQMLKTLKIGLEADLSDLKWNEKSIITSIASANEVIYSIENNMPYRDSISDHIGIMMFPVMFVNSTSAFETLKSKGINLISNDDLRNQIIDVYDSQYSFFLKNENMVVSEVIENAHRQLFSTRFEEAYVFDLQDKSNYKPRLTPLNFETLKTDQEFIYFIKSFKNRLNLLLEFHYRSRLLKYVDALIQAIDDEIKHLEND